jgi:2-polyprenyl-6-methoxyphenol hydroxylase-like FAD-dependent oxidoreductase
MNPSGAAAGTHAIHDAVTLTNWLSTLQSVGQKEIEKVFKEYRKERYPAAKAAFETSQMFTRNLGKVMNQD